MVVSQNPGNLTTNGCDGVAWLLKVMFKPMMHDPKIGAYTEMWAGLSPDVKAEDGGKNIIPCGRWHPAPKMDILESLRMETDGETGLAAKFWNYCEEQTKDFVA